MDLFGTGLPVVIALVLFGLLVFRWTGRGNTSLPEESSGDWDWPLAPDLQPRRGVSSVSRVYASKP